jgi:hypothetical protein
MTLLDSRSRLCKCSRGRLLHEIVKDRGGSRGDRNGGYASHNKGTHFLILLFLTYIPHPDRAKSRCIRV